MNASDHERCSELLRDHLQGRLSASEESWVTSHLAACSECRAEEAALRAMLLEEVAPLSEVERARLRRTVLATGAGSAAEIISPAPSARGGRMLQILGAAALLALIGGFLYTSGLSGGDGAGLADGGADSAESGPAPASGDASLEQSTEGSAGGAGGSTRALDVAAMPEPTFRRSLGTTTGRRLNRLGRRGLPLVVFSRAYQAEQVPELQSEFRDQLAAAAGPLADSVRECSDLVTSAFPTALPAYGAVATLEKLGDDEVLVLAFAWTDQTSGPLDQSMVWAWPADNCDQPVEYYKNVIEPRR